MSTVKTGLRFLLPSLLGAFIFLTPIRWNGELTIGIGIITSAIKALMGDYGLHILFAVLVASSVLTVIGSFLRPAWIRNNARFRGLFEVPAIWLFLRILGTVFCAMYLFQFGPELLTSDDISKAILIDIGVNVIAIYLSACLLLPLLTDFGFMEFVGTLARPMFRRAFRLPGRSAIDALASFVGASSVGCLITISQFENGHYTARQASVIATNFSIVSIPFCLVVAAVAGIPELFIPWYATVVMACLLIAFISPRLPPLNRKVDEYFDGSPERPRPMPDTGSSLISEAWGRAMDRAASSPNLTEFFRSGVTNLLFFLFAIVAAAMALATLAALVTFHTPIFAWLGTPFVGLLEIAKLPEATAAVNGLFSGFLDQYMPAVTASGIESKVTSFVLAGLSVCQLIFMSELGVIILRSSLPLGLRDLLAIFLIRTVISLPVLVLGAHLFAGR